MDWLLLGLGVVLVVVAMWDVFVTTLAVARTAGPLSGRVTHALWSVGLRVGGDMLLQALGLALTLVILLLWLALLWGGWTLIFSADPSAVVVTATGEQVGFWDRVYFAGYTLFTLGNGDLRADGPVWRVVAVLGLLNGLGLATLGITYLVPVTTAASERRRLAATISALGDRPDDILTRAWNGTDFGLLPQHLVALGPDIDLLAQRHLTYPVLHFFHSRERHAAAGVAISRLDEALMLLRAAVAERAALDASAVEPLHDSLTWFLDTLRSAFIQPADTAPPVPSLRALRAAGIPTVDDDTFAGKVQELDERRRALAGFIRNDGWGWDDVWTPPADADSDREQPKTANSE